NNIFKDESPDFTLNSRRTGGSDEGSEESEMEKNPGNPFTIHKNKYKQNWPYDHFMDGDHMNINPFGPQFQSLGPSGPELFFGRKWWYFNQDDYKPMG
ncbi:uncharacterized protein LOC124645005, partial [Helicoverpa zea]|uniref:uncharacterized protein LOC124645005 n=1 Tax=Helicoverpa zea TaxID=7113 RepID=UPI001F5743C3